MEELKPLAVMISRDFEVEDLQSEALLKERLVQAFTYLLEHDLAKMMQILYRTDVDEHKLKTLLSNNQELSQAEVIAEAYLNRQKEKIETRKKYSR